MSVEAIARAGSKGFLLDLHTYTPNNQTHLSCRFPINFYTRLQMRAHRRMGSRRPRVLRFGSQVTVGYATDPSKQPFWRQRPGP